MAKMTEKKDPFSYYFGSDFKGITVAAFNVLNDRLREQGQPKLKDLDDLKSRTVASGGMALFRVTKKMVGGKQDHKLIGIKEQQAFLAQSGVKNYSSLGFSSATPIYSLCEEAVKRTQTLVEGSAAPKREMSKRTSSESSNSTFSTACGETFDPDRCAEMSSNPYSQQRIEEFLQRFQIFAPKDSKYSSLCEILKAHWTKYMTDVLVDAFSNPNRVYTSKELRNMALERGIQIEGKPDQKIANDLIRFMIERLLILDATHYGLGDAADEMVRMLMEGSLGLESLTEKQRLAILMVGARFNKKLLNFVVAEASSDAEVEFQKFQQSLANLRVAVQNLPASDSIKVASGVAESIAKTEKAAEKQENSNLAGKTEPPIPTASRVAHDNENFVSNLKLTESGKTFKIMAKVLIETGYFHDLAKLNKKVHLFLTTDATLENILSKNLKNMSVEKFSKIPQMKDILRLVTFVESGNLISAIKKQNGKIASISKDKYTATLSADEKIITLKHNELGAQIKVSTEGKEHGGVRFYAATGLMVGPFMDDIIAAINIKTPPSIRKNPSPEAKKVPKKVEVDLPDVVNNISKLDLTPCEQLMAQYKQKSISKAGQILYGPHGVLKAVGHDLRSINDIKKLRSIVVGSNMIEGDISSGLLDFVRQVALAFNKQTAINSNFDVQVNFSNPTLTCKTLDDLINGKIKATPVVVAPKKAPSPKKQKEEEVEEEEEVGKELEDDVEDFPTLRDALEETGCSKMITLIETLDDDYPLREILDDDGAAGFTVFAPTDKAFNAFIEKHATDFTSFAENGDLVQTFVESLYALEDVEPGSTVETVGGDMTRVAKGKNAGFGASVLYVITKLDVPDIVIELLDLGEDTTAAEPTSDLKDLPSKSCERLEALLTKVGFGMPTMGDLVAKHLPKGLGDMKVEDAKLSLVLNFMDSFQGIGGSESDWNEVFNHEFVKYLQEMIIGYNGNERLAKKFSLDCSSFDRLYVAGHSKVVANVASKIAQTPAPPSKVAATSSNPLLKAIASRSELSESLSWLELTGLDIEIRDGKINTFFAPNNRAWDTLLKKFGFTKAEVADKRLKAIVVFLKYHMSEELLGLRSDEMDIVTLHNGETVPATSNYYGTGRIEVSEPDVGLYVISEVQTTQGVKQMRESREPEVLVSEIKTGKYVGASVETQSAEFERNAAKLKSPEKPKDVTLIEELTRGDFKIMTKLIQKIKIDMGKEFTLFVPTDEAFGQDQDANPDDLLSVYDAAEPTEDLIRLVKHHLILNRALSPANLRTLAGSDKLVMSDGQDEDLDLEEDQLYLRHSEKYKILSSVKVVGGYIHVINVVLHPLRETQNQRNESQEEILTSQNDEEDEEILGEDEEENEDMF